MGRTKKNGEGSAETAGPLKKMVQLFLSINGGELPQLVSQPIEKKSYAANRVLLPGCVVEVSDNPDENEAWEACGKVSDLCREGQKSLSATSTRNACCEHLSYAYSLLCDYVTDKFSADCLMSDETAETVLRGAIDRIKWAASCLDFKLEEGGDGN